MAARSANPGGGRWKARPALSLTLRVAVFLAPVVAATGCAVALSRLMPRPEGMLAIAGWWALLLAVPMLVMLAVERQARRLLPLAALLGLSLLFPDEVPSRFKVSRAIGSPGDLARRLAAAEEAGRLDEAERTRLVVEMVAMLSHHDRATRGHSERVRVYSDMLGGELHLSPEDRDRLRWASLLHDIGKLTVDPAVLGKPGRPDVAEWEMLRRHPTEGARLMAKLVPWLGGWADTVAHHHERWDGSGYPAGLRGNQISLGGRIVAVADAYEVMTSGRSYSRAKPPSAARQELVAASGTHFDPAVVRAFVNINTGRLWRAAGLTAWLGGLPMVGPVAAAWQRAGDAAVRLATAGATAGSVAAMAAAGIVSLPQVAIAQHLATPAARVAVVPSPAPAQQPAPTPPGGGPPSTSPEPLATPTPPPGQPPPAPGAPQPSPSPPRPAPSPSSPPPPPPSHAITVIGAPVPVGLHGLAETGAGSFADPPCSPVAQAGIGGSAGCGPWAAVVDYGDGSGLRPLALDLAGFTLSHTYVAAGAYVVTVEVTDGAGGSGSWNTQVVIT